jgi:hypothetical protein
VTRDRDAAGRPRNARPRDGLGRPLDRDEAGRQDEARIPDDLVLTGPDAAALADRLLRSGRPFHAHEVLEASWKSGPPAERDLWQGLAQIAVGLTHASRGNARGAITLLRRGAERVRAYQGQDAGPQGTGPQGTGPQGTGPQGTSPLDRDHPYGIDLAGFLAASEGLAARVAQHGVAGLAAADLRPRLTTTADR